MAVKMLETPIQQRTRLLAADFDIMLWRNNSGAAQDATGRLVRYGLANESAAENEVYKSADLVGVTPVVITPDMVGKTIGVFTGFETKKSGWHLTPGDKRAQAQANWGKLVTDRGGFFGFVNDPEQIKAIIGK